MFATQVCWKSGGRLASLALLGGMSLTPANAAMQVAASNPPLPSHTWLTLSDGWLCRTWSVFDESTAALAQATGTTLPLVITPASETAVSAESAATAGSASTVHCTRKWYVDGAGHLISGMPSWVPNTAGAWPASAGLPARKMSRTVAVSHHATRARQRPVRLVAQVVSARAPAPVQPPVGQPTSTGGGYNAWAPVPGHPGYAMSDFAGDPWHSYFGVCTWYAWYRHQSEPLMRLGNAAQWAYNAGSYGLRTGSTPAVGATAVFQPGVEGAGGGGHVAVVEQVLGGGWFIVSEMNFGLNGGGWGRIDWRYAYVAPGVSFIY